MLINQELDMHRRMRASLAGIVDLDPEGVPARIVETDWEIDRLEALIDAEAHPRSRPAPRVAMTTSDGATARAIEIVPIGSALRAA